MKKESETRQKVLRGLSALQGALIFFVFLHPVEAFNLLNPPIRGYSSSHHCSWPWAREWGRDVWLCITKPHLVRRHMLWESALFFKQSTWSSRSHCRHIIANWHIRLSTSNAKYGFNHSIVASCLSRPIGNGLRVLLSPSIYLTQCNGTEPGGILGIAVVRVALLLDTAHIPSFCPPYFRITIDTIIFCNWRRRSLHFQLLHVLHTYGSHHGCDLVRHWPFDQGIVLIGWWWSRKGCCQCRVEKLNKRLKSRALTFYGWFLCGINS